MNRKRPSSDSWKLFARGNRLHIARGTLVPELDMLYSLLLLLGYFLCAFARVAIPADTRSLHYRGDGDFTIPVQSKRRDTVVGDGKGYAPISGGEYFFTTGLFGSQELTVWVDTGSPYMWCYNSGLLANELGDRTPYNNGSTTADTSPTHGSFDITYGDDTTAKGPYITEQVSCGSIVIPDFKMGLPTEVTGNNWPAGMSCAMGLASHTDDYPETFFEAAVRLNMLSSPLFTADLSHKRAGGFTFGQVDKSQYHGEMNITASTGPGWAVSSNFITVGESTPLGAYEYFLVDTATAMIALPHTIVNAYITSIPGWTQVDTVPYRYQLPCDAKMQDIHISFTDGGAVTIKGDTLLLTNYQGTGTCRSMVDWMDDGSKILGTPAFLSNFVEFRMNDEGTYQVGFATNLDYAS